MKNSSDQTKVSRLENLYHLMITSLLIIMIATFSLDLIQGQLFGFRIGYNNVPMWGTACLLPVTALGYMKNKQWLFAGLTLCASLLLLLNLIFTPT